MTTILLYGSSFPDCSSLTTELCSTLSKNGGAIYLNGSDVRRLSECEECEFLILESEKPLNLQLENGIIVFKSKLTSFSTLLIPASFTAVVESCNSAALTLLKRSDIDVITCGMASTDTMSLSSISEQSGAVSLQRAVKTLSGSTIEASEIPVSFATEPSEYGLLASCAVLMLSGKSPEHGYQL